MPSDIVKKIDLGINNILTMPMGSGLEDNNFPVGNTPPGTVTVANIKDALYGSPLINLSSDDFHNIANIPVNPPLDFFIDYNNSPFSEHYVNFPNNNTISNIFDNSNNSYHARPPLVRDNSGNLPPEFLAAHADVQNHLGGVEAAFLVIDLGKERFVNDIKVTFSNGTQIENTTVALSNDLIPNIAQNFAFKDMISLEKPGSTVFGVPANFQSTDYSTTQTTIETAFIDSSTMGSFGDGNYFGSSTSLTPLQFSGQNLGLLKPAGVFREPFDVYASNKNELQTSAFNYTFEYKDIFKNPEQYIKNTKMNTPSGYGATRYVLIGFRDVYPTKYLPTFTTNPTSPGAEKFMFSIQNITINEMLPGFELQANSNVEFDDGLLDLKGWRNPRYDGSKLIGKEINKFTKPTKQDNEVIKNGDFSNKKNKLAHWDIVGLPPSVGPDTGGENLQGIAYVGFGSNSGPNALSATVGIGDTGQEAKVIGGYGLKINSGTAFGSLDTTNPHPAIINNIGFPTDHIEVDTILGIKTRDKVFKGGKKYQLSVTIKDFEFDNSGAIPPAIRGLAIQQPEINNGERIEFIGNGTFTRILKVKSDAKLIFNAITNKTSLIIEKVSAFDMDDPIQPYEGDTSYGRNPVVERKTTAFYIVDTCIGGEENDRYATLIDHSYLGIKQILVIDEQNRSVQLIDRKGETADAFKKFITNDFPVGGKFKARVIDESIQNSLKNEYHVKMNKGCLLKSFEYDGFAAPKYMKNLDGDVATAEDGGLFGGLGDLAYNPNPFKLIDFIESSIVSPYDDSVSGVSEFLNQSGDDGNGLSLTPELDKLFNTQPLYRGNFEVNVDNDFYGNANENKTIYQYPYQHNPLALNNLSSFNIPDTLAPTPEEGAPRLGQGRFQFEYGNPLTQPLMCGDNSKIKKNKFTRRFVGKNISGSRLSSFKLATVNELQKGLNNYVNDDGDYIFSTDQTATGDFHPAEWVYTGLLGQFFYVPSTGIVSPSVSASLFIQECVKFLSKNSTETELHLTLHKGEKSYSNKNDELSIGTFEVDSKIPVKIAENSGVDIFSSTKPTLTALILKNDPRNKPTADFLLTKDRGLSGSNTSLEVEHIYLKNYPGQPNLNSHSSFAEDFEYYQIHKRFKLFDAGPGFQQSIISDGNALQDDRVTLRDPFGLTFDGGNNMPGGYPKLDVDGYEGTYALNSSSFHNFPTNFGDGYYGNNTQNYPGAEEHGYHFQLSFLDEAPVIITDIDKENELFDGIGDRGLVLIPDNITPDIKKNVDYYLRKAGIITRKTIRSPRRPERGR